MTAGKNLAAEELCFSIADGGVKLHDYLKTDSGVEIFYFPMEAVIFLRKFLEYAIQFQKDIGFEEYGERYERDLENFQKMEKV